MNADYYYHAQLPFAVVFERGGEWFQRNIALIPSEKRPLQCPAAALLTAVPDGVAAKYRALDEPKLLGVTEAAQVANVTPNSIRRAIQSGALRGEKVGSGYVIAEFELHAWIERRRRKYSNS